MANVDGRDLDRSISLITSHISAINLLDASFLTSRPDPHSQSNGEDDDSTLISRSFMLEELLDSCDEEASTLEVYKDILNEKINSKSKIPAPSTSNHKLRLTTLHSPNLNHSSDSKLPVSVSKKLSLTASNSIELNSSIRSVSDSPLKPYPRLKVFRAPNRFDDSLNNPSLTVSSKIGDLSQKRRKFHSMLLPSMRMLSAPLALSSSQRALQPLSSPSTQSRVPSYLKQTTSSMRKAAPVGRENKENQHGKVDISRLPSSSSIMTITTADRANRRRSHAGHSQAVLSKPFNNLDVLQERSSPLPVLKNDSNLLYTLDIPKVRKTNKQENELPQRQPSIRNSSDKIFVPKGIPRSQTQADLNASLHPTKQSVNTAPKIRKASASLENRKVSTSSSFPKVRSASLNTPRKISSVADLYKNISKSSLIKTWERIQNHRFAKVDPIDPAALKGHSRYQLLNNYERGEVLRRSQIFYVGDKRKPEVEVLKFNKNFGFDDNEGNYLVENGDHIQYRFRVLSKLGNGAFGSVVVCNDYKQDRICAVKIVKNEMTCSLQAVSEVKILKALAKCNPEKYYIMQYFLHFHFRGHMCIATEYLPMNLYQVLEISNFRGFKMSVIVTFANQILQALKFLHVELKTIHCDLKPENLMLVSPYSFDLKLIDFGSAVPINEISYSYLQSRFYRAPEVTLGARYNEKIDIWSFATILVELFTGVPIFPCENENDLMLQYLELIGKPNSRLIRQLQDDIYTEGAVGGNLNESSLLWQVFTGKGELVLRELQKRTSGRPIKISSRNLRHVLRTAEFSDDDFESSLLELFMDMIGKCFVWDYHSRASAENLLDHELFKYSSIES